MFEDAVVRPQRAGNRKKSPASGLKTPKYSDSSAGRAGVLEEQEGGQDVQRDVDDFRDVCKGNPFRDEQGHRCLKQRKRHHRRAPHLEVSRHRNQFPVRKLDSRSMPRNDARRNSRIGRNLNVTITKGVTCPKLPKFNPPQRREGHPPDSAFAFLGVSVTRW